MTRSESRTNEVPSLGPRRTISMAVPAATDPTLPVLRVPSGPVADTGTSRFPVDWTSSSALRSTRGAPQLLQNRARSDISWPHRWHERPTSSPS